MIAGGQNGGDSHRARKSQAEWSGPKNVHDDALAITTLLVDYEVGHIFIDLGSSVDILFGDAYNQMQLGVTPLEKVNTSLYGFVGEVLNPQGMISLPLTLGTRSTRITCLLKFLVVDTPYAYNAILGRPILNTFQAISSTYHMKIKFPTIGGVGEVQGDPLQSRKCYVEVVRKGQKGNKEEACKEAPPNKWVKDDEWMEDAKGAEGAPPKVQPAEELLNIKLVPRDPEKTTRIGSKMENIVQEKIIQCLRHNMDIFAWTPQDLDGIDPIVITHHLNIDPDVKPVKQKKRHFRLEKDKIIQAEIDKLMAAGHIQKIQFPEWLSNVVLVPKLGEKWRMCIDLRDLNKACPKDFYPLSRIDQLVDSTSECELLSMMDAFQGYHKKCWPLKIVKKEHAHLEYKESASSDSWLPKEGLRPILSRSKLY
ncbi:UNVERIFIED_CONTAM: hypothetical protein Sradi_4880900 [Sesamum radiatum]|uniref:Reverse transcriptase domain-containing protein n=1 Tax=Sesamum radiatum TaxID=300843 RepID=A0AAW2MYU1_SESRA